MKFWSSAPGNDLLNANLEMVRKKKIIVERVFAYEADDNGEAREVAMHEATKQRDAGIKVYLVEFPQEFLSPADMYDYFILDSRFLHFRVVIMVCIRPLHSLQTHKISKFIYRSGRSTFSAEIQTLWIRIPACYQVFCRPAVLFWAWAPPRRMALWTWPESSTRPKRKSPSALSPRLARRSGSRKMPLWKSSTSVFETSLAISLSTNPTSCTSRPMATRTSCSSSRLIQTKWHQLSFSWTCCATLVRLIVYPISSSSTAAIRKALHIAWF